MADNHRRVSHLEGAVRHLDDRSSALRRKCNALHQEEIIEEIEIILLSATLVDHSWPIFTPFAEDGFVLLANVGIVLLLFRVGLRSSLSGLIAKLPRASLIWIGDVLVSSSVGYLSARYLLDLPEITSLVIAAALSATSVAVSVALWQETKTIDSDTGQLLVDVAELDDISALLLMALLIAVIPVMQAGGGDVLVIAGEVTAVLLLKLGLFVAFCYLFAHYIEPHVTRFSRRVEHSRSGLTLTIAGIGFAIAALAGLLGVSMIPRAEIAMVIVYQCRQLGERVVPDEILAGMVLVTAATAIVCPLILRPLLKRRVQE